MDLLHRMHDHGDDCQDWGTVMKMTKKQAAEYLENRNNSARTTSMINEIWEEAKKL